MKNTTGLSESEAKKNITQYGLNVLPEEHQTPDSKLLLRQIKSPLIYVLFFAAAVSLLVGEFSDALVIMFAVGVNTTLGFVQERKAERSLRALKQILSTQAKVIRDGVQKTIDARLVVPGDLLVVGPGDKVPADGIVVEAQHLLINEAILTGESVSVVKHSSQKTTANSDLLTSNSRVFMGTVVAAGMGKIRVTATGSATEVGKIAANLIATPSPPTPLQTRLSGLAKILTLVIGFTCIAVFILGIATGKPGKEMFIMAVAIAVAAIPEGLSVTLTVILAIGMQRILKRNALVRNLIAAETLGSVTVIATDKTGTLTEGTLKVVDIATHDRQRLLKAAVMVNNLLDPLEVAIWEWVQKEGIDPQELRESTPIKKIFPFDPHLRIAATTGDDATYFMGAPEGLLKRSLLTDKEQANVEKQIAAWGKRGLRLIALGYRKGTQSFKIRDVGRIEWLGLVGFADPVRSGVKEALQTCRTAGVSVKVITGDYRFTAESVLKQLGLTITHPETQIIEGEELEQITHEELSRRVKEIVLFTRVTPIQKLKIVEALRHEGEVVALIGDGVNDAPAIQTADIGIVVGSASDVARETADMVLLDSNFATIVAAIEEGRSIYDNIQKVILYLVGNSFAEVVLVVGALLLGIPLPITAVQILWINILSDGFPSIALTAEPKEKDLLRRRPIQKDSPLINKPMQLLMATISLIIGLTSLIAFLLARSVSGDLVFAQTVTFGTLGIGSLIYVLAIRRLYQPLWKGNIFANPYVLLAVGGGVLLQLLAIYAPPLQKLLHTHPVGKEWWGVMFAAAILVIVGVELVKLVNRFFSPILFRQEKS